MTELMANLILTLNSEPLRLLGDIVTPEQRRSLKNGKESGIKLCTWEFWMLEERVFTSVFICSEVHLS